MSHGGGLFFFFWFVQRASRIVFVFCAISAGATGVNMLEKSDLGQRPCLHLSR